MRCRSYHNRRSRRSAIASNGSSASQTRTGLTIPLSFGGRGDDAALDQFADGQDVQAAFGGALGLG